LQVQARIFERGYRYLAKINWEVVVQGVIFRIELTHRHSTGFRSLKVNGELIFKDRDFFDIGGDYPFLIDEDIFIARIVRQGIGFNYDLVINGVSITTNEPVDFSFMIHHQEKWERMCKKGKQHYLWYSGFLGIGVSTGVLWCMGWTWIMYRVMRMDFSFYPFMIALLISLLIWPFFGMFAAYSIWHTYEKKFGKPEDQNI